MLKIRYLARNDHHTSNWFQQPHHKTFRTLFTPAFITCSISTDRQKKTWEEKKDRENGRRGIQRTKEMLKRIRLFIHEDKLIHRRKVLWKHLWAFLCSTANYTLIDIDPAHVKAAKNWIYEVNLEIWPHTLKSAAHTRLCREMSFSDLYYSLSCEPRPKALSESCFTHKNKHVCL